MLMRRVLFIIVVMLSVCIIADAQLIIQPSGNHAPQSSHDPVPPPSYPHLIITTRELAPAFGRLVAWRNARDLKSGVVCIEDLMETPTEAYSLFDNICQIDGSGNREIITLTDSAAVLRGYLRYCRQSFSSNRCHYVLLALNGVYRAYRGIPSDLYFTDLTTRWNRYSDNTFDFDTSSTALPDLSVGRLMCSTPEEVMNYIDKVIRYERNPGDGDASYLTRGVYTECDWMQGLHWADVKLKNMLDSIVDDYTLFYEYDFHNPTGTQVVNDIDINHYGIWGLQGHGSPLGISVNNLPSKYLGLLPYGITSTTASPAHLVNEAGNALNCMTHSKLYPSVCYTVACTVMPYDQYSNPNNFPNFGQSFTCGKGYGGVAFLGNTRDGYGVSISLEQMFFKQITEVNSCIGRAEAASRSMAFYPNVSDQAMAIRAAHNLLGDPAINMWTTVPDTITFDPPVAHFVRQQFNSCL